MKWDGGDSCTLLDARTEGGDAAELPDVARGQRRSGRLLPRALRRGGAGGAEAACSPRADGQGALRSSPPTSAPRWSRGSLPLGDALDAHAAFLADDDLRVFARGLDLLMLLNRARARRRSAPPYGRAVAKLFGARAHTVGWTPKPGEDPEMAQRAPGAARAGGAAGARSRRSSPRRTSWPSAGWHDRRAVAPDMVGSRAAHGGLSERRQALRSRCSPRRAASRTGASARCCSARSAASARRRLQMRALALVIGSEFDLRESIGTALSRRCSIARRARRPGPGCSSSSTASSARCAKTTPCTCSARVPLAFCDEHASRAAADLPGAARQDAPRRAARARRSARDRSRPAPTSCERATKRRSPPSWRSTRRPYRSPRRCSRRYIDMRSRPARRDASETLPPHSSRRRVM